MANIFGYGGTSQRQLSGSPFGRPNTNSLRRPMFGIGALNKMNQMQQQVNQGKQVFGPAALTSNLKSPFAGQGFLGETRQAIESDFMRGEQANLNQFKRLQSQEQVIGDTTKKNREIADQQIGELGRIGEERFEAGQDRIADFEGKQLEVEQQREESALARTKALKDFGVGVERLTSGYKQDAEKFSKKMGRLGNKVSNAGQEYFEEAATILKETKEEIEQDLNVDATSSAIFALRRNAENKKEFNSLGVRADGSAMTPQEIEASNRSIDMDTNARLQGVIGNVMKEETLLKSKISERLAGVKVQQGIAKQKGAAIGSQIEISGAQAELSASNFKTQALLGVADLKLKDALSQEDSKLQNVMDQKQSTLVINQMEQENFGARQMLASQIFGLSTQAAAAETAGNIQLANFMLQNKFSPASRFNAQMAFAYIASAPGAAGLPTLTT